MKRPANLKSALFWMLLLTFGLWTLTSPAQNKSALPPNETPASENSDNKAGSPGPASEKSPPALVPVIIEFEQDEEDDSEVSFDERINQWAAKAVEHLANVLFKKVGASERKQIIYRNAELFYRQSEGLTSDFQILGGDDQSLTEQDIEAGLKAGRFNETKIASGTLSIGGAEAMKIEYVTRLVKKETYIQDEAGVFRAKLPMLEQLSETDTLSGNEIDAALHAGLLTLDDDGNHIQVIEEGGMPFVVVWLACGAVFFTIFMKGVNFWGVRHAIEVVRGKFDNPDEEGEVTHMQALASALSATVGLGNIAGVTIAMTMGGPGAFFWMMMCGLFGMTSKFVECTLGQKYRRIKEDGSVLGGPMAYLPQGLQELGVGPLGVILGFLFTCMCIMGSFGGGNMFQSNQAGQQMLTMFQAEDRAEMANLNAQIKQAGADNNTEQILELDSQREALKAEMDDFGDTFKMGFGLIMATLVAIVIIGGIKSIGKVAERIVPAMCLIYIIACLWVILMNLTEIPSLISMIFTEAFNPEAFGGGLVGVLVIGVQRAAFSNEAGVGSAAIVHSAAKTDEPIREGFVALLEPFIDTIVVCSMTALVILITGAWNNTDWIVEQGLAGTSLTSEAFESVLPWFPYILTLAVVLFAFSTMISWSYYGERCWENLFGGSKFSVYTYKAIFIVAVFMGANISLGAVLDFSDMMILCMAFPNVLGLVLLSPKVRRDLADYWRRYKAGEFKTYK